MKYTYQELLMEIRVTGYNPLFPFFDGIQELKELGIVKVWPAEHALADVCYTLPKGVEPLLEWARLKDAKERLDYDPQFFMAK